MGHVTCMREVINEYNILVGKPLGKKPLGRPGHRWEDSIVLYLQGIEYEGVDWIHLAQNWDQWQTLLKTVMNL